MRLGALAAAVFAAGVVGGAAVADEAQMIAGSYLLHQADGYFRILSFDADGKVSQLSDQQSLLGFTGGQGTWSARGDGAAGARIIDFTHDPESGERTGAGLIDYDLSFGDAADGRYQSVTGSYAGKQWAPGVSPLAPDADPVGAFGIGFSGRRIPAP